MNSYSRTLRTLLWLVVTVAISFVVRYCLRAVLP